MRLARVLLACCALLAARAPAHVASNGFVQIDVHGRELAGSVELAIRDVELAVGVDAKGDGQVTWGELRAGERPLELSVAESASDRTLPRMIEVGRALKDEDGANAIVPLLLQEAPRGAAEVLARFTAAPPLTEIFFSPETEVQDQHVLLVETLVQSGVTSEFLLRHLAGRGAASVKMAALLDKQSARRVSLQPDYFGFLMNESFVVGYGLGAPQVGRNLPYIAARAQNSSI